MFVWADRQYMYIYTHVYVYMIMDVCVCIGMQVGMYMLHYVCIHPSIHPSIHPYIHTQTHIDTYTHTCAHYAFICKHTAQSTHHTSGNSLDHQNHQNILYTHLSLTGVHIKCDLSKALLIASTSSTGANRPTRSYRKGTQLSKMSVMKFCKHSS